MASVDSLSSLTRLSTDFRAQGTFEALPRNAKVERAVTERYAVVKVAGLTGVAVSCAVVGLALPESRAMAKTLALLASGKAAEKVVASYSQASALWNVNTALVSAVSVTCLAVAAYTLESPLLEDATTFALGFVGFKSYEGFAHAFSRWLVRA